MSQFTSTVQLDRLLLPLSQLHNESEEQAALRLSPEERLAILALERRHVEALRQEAERFLAENKED